MLTHTVFITGGTGYIGSRLIDALLERGHTVRALARRTSFEKLSTGCAYAIGDALNRSTYANQIVPADTFVHLVGTPNPSPWHAEKFRDVDLASAREAIAAARESGINHFIYVSVAHPAPLMGAYIAARMEAELLLRESGMKATILQPWYVLGPGHRWPLLLLPFYWIGALLPPTRAAAGRLGLVTIGQMIRALVDAVQHPPAKVRTLTVPDIRRFG
ncbi:MAG: NAD(P)H-binding protein [Anaerolineae bacterium]|nr:NAD(P)H-binding protein [Gemmatimonadaceae bacterium]